MSTAKTTTETRPAAPTFAELVPLVPNLAHMESMCRGYDGIDWRKFWYGGIKEWVLPAVGWERSRSGHKPADDPDVEKMLRSNVAYDVVYDHLSGLLMARADELDRHRREWVKTLRGEGMAVAEIAKTIGIPTWAVFHYLTRDDPFGP